MDPMIPYSQSAGYIGLLHSQHESVHHENSPYESFHSGSSQIPQFSSQQCEAPTPPTDTPVERGRRHKWTPAEDEMLISAWLNTSKDAIVGNNQKSGTFWKRGDFVSTAHLLSDGSPPDGSPPEASPPTLDLSTDLSRVLSALFSTVLSADLLTVLSTVLLSHQHRIPRFEGEVRFNYNNSVSISKQL
ncbi:hypothetical protein DY000_02034335 [Brassica cretica]|uniref:Myb-like domain-containing protein n=1 Tax=Brassica cretica TaxID=69181 RepID=A0ABQ7DBY7_BRACR|nr:hypothetical protein DY000_02034335 [Brassica cretica]